MSIRIACPRCRNTLKVSDDSAGKRLRCPGCQAMLQIPVGAVATVPAPDDAFMEDTRSLPRRRSPDEPRRSARKTKTPNHAFWWSIAGASAFGVLLLAVILIVALKGGTSENGKDQQNNAKGSGEQIYQRLLKSTVWIEANLRAAGPGERGGPGGLPVATGTRGGAQVGPKFGPKLGPKFGPPKIGGPLGGGQLVNTVWDGSEQLQNYGRLRFEFTSPSEVTMIDARDTVPGMWRSVGNSITLEFFNGDVIYTGVITGDVMRGTARNGKDVWNWSVSRSGGVMPGPRPNPGGPSFGSGSLIDGPQRLIVTNVHVVGGADNVLIYFPRFDGKGDVIAQRDAYPPAAAVNGRVVLREERADLALVQLDRLPADARVVPLSSEKAKPGQQVHSVGNPGASKALWIYSPGKVRQVYQDQWDIPDNVTGRRISYNAMKLETDSPINPGDSGGPLVNDKGALVGVAHATDRAAANFSYFIEVSEVRTLVQRYYQNIGQRWVPPAE
jgi:S1-C subfamily serine protease